MRGCSTEVPDDEKKDRKMGIIWDFNLYTEATHGPEGGYGDCNVKCFAPLL